MAFTFYDSASQYAISTLCGTVYIAKTRDLSTWHSEYIFGILTSRSCVQTSWLAMGLLSTLLLYNSCRGEEWIVNPCQGLFFFINSKTCFVPTLIHYRYVSGKILCKSLQTSIIIKNSVIKNLRIYQNYTLLIKSHRGEK